MKRHFLCVVLTLSVGGAVQSASAQRYDDSDSDRFSLKLGSFSVRDYSTRVRIDSSAGVVGTVLDFEDTLRVDDSVVVARLDGYYRFNPRHRLNFSYFDIDRNGTATLTQDVQFGEQTFTAGTSVLSDINTEIIKLGYSYSFIHVGEFEFGIGGGLHLTKVEVGLQGSTGGQAQRVDGTSPLPVFSFRGEFNFTPKLSVQGRNEVFFISTDSYKGSFSDFLLALDHQTFDNVGFGLGFNRINFDLEATDGALRGEVETNYNGWLLYADVGF